VITGDTPTGPYFGFHDADVAVIIDALQHISNTAMPSDVA